MIEKTTYTPWYVNAQIGLVIGTTEAYINHPIWALKTRIQAGYPFTLRPSILYRGVVGHASLSVPMDALQICVSRMASERLFPKDCPESISRTLSGAIGGASAAIFSCPQELVMTIQQKHPKKQNFSTTFTKLYQTGGLKKLYQGFIPTISREIKFGAGFYGLAPSFTKALENRGVEKKTATLIGGLSAGVFTSLISQPDDTLKTLIQDGDGSLHLNKIIRQVWQTSGIKGFMQGWHLRISRVALSIFILGSGTSYLESISRNR